MVQFNNLQIDEEMFHMGRFQSTAQNLMAFNEASNGGIQMINEALGGFASTDSIFASLEDGTSRRDSASDGAITAGDINTLADLTERSIKRDTKFAMSQKIAALKKSIQTQFNGDIGQFSFGLGASVTTANMKYKLNDALGASVAALLPHIGENAYIEPGDGGMQTETLNEALATQGDMSESIVALVMHSRVYRQLIGTQIAANIFGISSINVREGSPVTFDKPVIVTDSPNLVSDPGVGGTVRDYFTLGLRANGVMVKESEEETIYADADTGKENLQIEYRHEGAHNIHLKGFAWADTAPNNPLDAQLTTSTNWTPIDTADGANKRRAGFIVQTRHGSL